VLDPVPTHFGQGVNVDIYAVDGEGVRHFVSNLLCYFSGRLIDWSLMTIDFEAAASPTEPETSSTAIMVDKASSLA
jgi:hypothetical protein